VAVGRLSWPVRIGLAVLWILTVIAALSVDDRESRLVLVVVLSVMATVGTSLALVAKWRKWRPGLAVEGISLILAVVGLWLMGFVPLLLLGGLVGALVAFLLGRWRRRESEGELS
jgi:hypothetical protein